MNSKNKRIILITIILLLIFVFFLTGYYFSTANIIFENGKQYFEFGFLHLLLISLIGIIIFILSFGVIFLINKLFNILKKNEIEAQNLIYHEKIREWKNDGLHEIIKILSDKTENIDELSTKIISFLVTYINAAQGGLFICNNEKENLKNIKLIASYGFSDNQKKIFNFGEGLIGTCAVEKKVIYLENIPDNYFKITSLLGQAQPASLLIVPLIIEDQIYGIIEIGAFQKLETYVKDFIINVSENISNTLFKLNVALQTAELLKQTQIQAFELSNKEEILKQNIEELNSVQENILKQNELIFRNEQRVKTIINNSPEIILIVNKQGIIELVSEQCFNFLQYLPSELENNSISKILKFLKLETIKIGERKRQKILRKDGTTYMTEVYVGEIQNNNNSTTNYLMFLKDVTLEIKKEFDIIKALEMAEQQKQIVKTQNEELQATEEELRQNMEEMQTIQEELIRQKNNIIKSEQQVIAILDNSPELILVLNKDGKIKSSSNHLKILTGYEVSELLEENIMKILKFLKIDKIQKGDKKR